MSLRNDDFLNLSAHILSESRPPGSEMLPFSLFLSISSIFSLFSFSLIPLDDSCSALREYLL